MERNWIESVMRCGQEEICHGKTTQSERDQLIMDMKLEVLVVPVSDVDRAKRFYEKLGFRLDIDYVANENFRVAQFTPPGSEASIIIGKVITSAAPGSLQNLHLVVFDIEEAPAHFVLRGIALS